MPTETLPTRRSARAPEKTSAGFALALTLHLLCFAALGAAAFLSRRAHPHWGDRDPTAGSIAVNAVSALPLPPRQRFKENEVLASDHPSIAPTPPPPTPVPAKSTPPPPKAEPLPKPNEVLLNTKTPPPKPTAKPADKPTPPAPTRPTPPPPPTNKATTGETAGIQIPQSVSPLKNGTASITVDERSFGDRYAYYIQQISRKIGQSKSQDTDPPDTRGKKAYIHFTIDRDGTPVDAQIVTRGGGSATLDTATLRAIQRIDTFGPLPQGDHITILFEYDSK